MNCDWEEHGADSEFTLGPWVLQALNRKQRAGKSENFESIERGYRGFHLSADIVDFLWVPISWISFERGYRGFSIRDDIVVFYRSWYHGFCGKSSEWPSGQQCRTLGGSTILSQSLTSVNWLWRLVVEHRRKIHAINVDEIFRSTHIYFTSQTHSRNKCHWNIWARILRSNTCQVWLNTTRQIMKTENAVFFRKKRYSEKKV